MKNLKKRLRNSDLLVGCLLNLGSRLTAEIVGQAGFDWVMIDLEHGAGNEKDALSQLQALRHSATGAIVRVESNDKRRIQRALDIGAEGIICPQVETVADVQAVINGMYYHPDGKRGVSPMVRATRFGEDFDRYRREAKENLLCIIQIETKEALENLDEIVALNGVDALFIGPLDLTMALGIFGQFDHPKYIKAVKAVVSSATNAGKAIGIYLPDIEDYPLYHDMGIRLIVSGSDTTFLVQGAKQLAEAFSIKKKIN